MDTNEPQDEVREVVGVFHKVEDVHAAVDELLNSGFDRAELSLLASEKAVEAKLGNCSFRRAEPGDNPSTPQTAYVSPATMGAAEGGIIGGLAYVGGVADAGVIAVAGGPLTAIVLGAVVAEGAGGLLGTGLAGLVGHWRATYFQEQLDRGGLLLWVRPADKHREQKAIEILARNSGEEVHVHNLPTIGIAKSHAPTK